MQAGRGFSWETYHDALPGCVGSGLHQVPRIQDLPRQGDHRRLQKRRTAAGGFEEKAVAFLERSPSIGAGNSTRCQFATIGSRAAVRRVHSVKCGRLQFWKRYGNPLTLTDEGRSLNLLPHAGPGLILKPKA